VNFANKEDYEVKKERDNSLYYKGDRDSDNLRGESGRLSSGSSD
jgi:hypothetical protein